VNIISFIAFIGLIIFIPILCIFIIKEITIWIFKIDTIISLLENIDKKLSNLDTKNAIDTPKTILIPNYILKTNKNLTHEESENKNLKPNKKRSKFWYWFFEENPPNE